jgi:SAM-dependent methyltransferase
MLYNRVLSVLDYNDTIRSRKAWEIDLAMRILLDHGAIHEDSRILIPGAGHETTIYLLSADVKEVVALDLYEKPGMWGGTAPSEMLTNPAKFAPPGLMFDSSRITVVHGDMRDLSRFEDGEFDAICSLGSIEHVGSWADVSQAAKEIGRVLKPGGVAAITTEYRHSGPGVGWPGVLVFSADELETIIVKPSGLKWIDSLCSDVDEDTLATVYPLATIVQSGRLPDPEAMLSEHGYLFTSVMLALRKPEKRGSKGKQ